MHPIRLSICLLFAVSLWACGSKPHTPAHSADTETLYQPAYAQGFRIVKNPAGDTILCSINPWQGATDVSTNFKVCKHPRRIVVMSSTHAAMLAALGQDSLIRGVGGLQYISDKALKERPDLADVGYEGNVDYETLASTRPDLVIIYGTNGPSATEAALKRLQIPYVYFGDYLEEHPLGKAEWLVAMAAITGQANAARSIFSHIIHRYDSVRNSIPPLKQRPRVILNAPYGGVWHYPPAGSYAVRLIEDAGGEVVGLDHSTPRSNSSVRIDDETAYQNLCKADFWINPAQATSLTQLVAMVPLASQTNLVKHHRVFNNTLRATPGGGNDYFESGVVCPDIILSDLVKILHNPDSLSSLTYYKQLQ